MANTLSDADRDAIHAEIFAGRKISAIKLYREATRNGLKEAKDAVEAMDAELRQTDAARFSYGPSKKGCLPVVLLAGMVYALGSWLWREG